jgi:prepilin-type N-terminal cleavage/methylation domain-containing protein
MRRPVALALARRGFTLAEMLMAVAALGIVTSVMYALLNFGVTMFARNVAVNMAHQQARNGLMRVSRDLHQAVSIPQLVDDKLQQVNTVGPSAGITFQIVTNGPFEIMNDPTSPSLIQIATTNPRPTAPAVGDHLVVLDYDVEADVTKITATGAGSNHWNVFLTNGNEKRIQTKKDSFVVGYITRRVGYIVSNGELRYFPNLIATPATYYVVARNITSATPFKIPLNDTGTPDTRYTSVTLSAMDPTYSKRSYKSTSMQLVDARVPYRCQITKYQ